MGSCCAAVSAAVTHGLLRSTQPVPFDQPAQLTVHACHTTSLLPLLPVCASNPTSIQLLTTMLRPTGAGQQGPAWRWCHASRHCAAETGSLQCSAQLCLQPRPTLDSSSVLLQAHSYNSLYKCCLVL